MGRIAWLLPLAMLLITGSRASAQPAASAVAPVALSATKVAGLTVLATANATQSIAEIQDGTTTDFGPAPVSILTQWDVKPGQTASIRLVGYFLSAFSALSDGVGTDIPPSEVEALMSTVPGMQWSKFVQPAVVAGAQTFGVDGAGILFWTVPISGLNKKSSRTDQLALRLNMTARATGLPAGDYAGTLFLRAIAF